MEQIQDAVERRLMAASLDDVARAFVLYRRKRAELREAKALLQVRDDLKLSLAAVTVVRERYLRRDDRGRPVESTAEMLDRVAAFVAGAEDVYEPGASTEWAERFSGLLRSLEFLPNSPTLMNAGTPVGLLSGCVVLPVGDSLRSIFAALGHAALVHQAGGGTGYAFSHVRPEGDIVAGTGGTASGPLSFLHVFDTAAEVLRLGGRRRAASMAVLDVSHPDVHACSSTRSIGPTRPRGSGPSRRRTPAVRCRCCRTSPATWGRSTSPASPPVVGRTGSAWPAPCAWRCGSSTT